MGLSWYEILERALFEVLDQDGPLPFKMMKVQKHAV